MSLVFLLLVSLVEPKMTRIVHHYLTTAIHPRGYHKVATALVIQTRMKTNELTDLLVEEERQERLLSA